MDARAEIATELQALLDAQRGVQARDLNPGWDTRRIRLRALEDLLRGNAEAICAAINQDFGCRPAEETQLLELFPSLDGIRHALRHGRRWMRARRRPAGVWFLPAWTELVPQPLGVVGVIVPWNYPLYLAVGPITDALTAGNCVLVKMSEYTPHFSALFARLVATAFPAGEVRVVTGDADVARAFSALAFDHLLFTGSTEVGRHVMRAAADNLTPVTLELGGKSPAIIGPNARLAHAVERIVWGKCVNAGQTCIAPDYVLLPRGREDEFVQLACSAFARFYPEYERRGQYASIVNARQHERLIAMRDGAVAMGARAHALAQTPGDDAARVMAPTVLTGVTPTMRVMQDEIFGPLLPLVPYDGLDDALRFVAERPHPLSLYLFDTDRAVQRQVLRASIAGGVTINDTLQHIAQHHLPFGGVGASGMGAYHGKAGFETFSRLKPMFHQARFNGAALVNPPYGRRFRRMLKLLLRR